MATIAADAIAAGIASTATSAAGGQSCCAFLGHKRQKVTGSRCD